MSPTPTPATYGTRDQNTAAYDPLPPRERSRPSYSVPPSSPSSSLCRLPLRSTTRPLLVATKRTSSGRFSERTQAGDMPRSHDARGWKSPQARRCRRRGWPLRNWAARSNQTESRRLPRQSRNEVRCVSSRRLNSSCSLVEYVHGSPQRNRRWRCGRSRDGRFVNGAGKASSAVGVRDWGTNISFVVSVGCVLSRRGASVSFEGSVSSIVSALVAALLQRS